MDRTRFDALTRSLAESSDRRATLRLLAGGTLGALAGLLALDGPDAADARTRCRGGKKPCGKRCIPKDQCCPGRTRSCYTGPAGTAGVGVCKAGSQTCQSDGTWGPCNGEVTPQSETCNGKDDDCNGQVDNGALCPGGRSCQHGRCCEPEFYTCTIDGTFPCCDGLTCRPDAQLGGHRCHRS